MIRLLAVLSLEEIALANFADARLRVVVAQEKVRTIGAFERATEEGIWRRRAGGGEARLEPGTVWLELELDRVDALVPCTADKILNRYTRPLLRALTRVSGVKVSYFGRDWVSGAQRPVAMVGFAHEARSGRAVFEAIVGVGEAVAGGRGTFLGKVAVGVEELARKRVEPRAVAEAIVEAYREISGTGTGTGTFTGEMAELAAVEPAWAATCEEAIGKVGAGRDGRGRFRIGGEFMASRDAVAWLEAEIERGTRDIGRAVDEAFTTGGAVVFGVRSLQSIRDVIEASLPGA